MSDEQGREKEGFKVTDRRSFTAEGDLRKDKAETESEGPARPQSPPAGPRRVEGPAGAAGGPQQAAGRGEPARGGPGSAVAMDFSSFLLSLATTAMVHLGEIGDPAGGRGKVNLDAAKQMVEILAMLQQKTEGNRTAEENRLLDDILYEIRMKILAKTKAIQL